MMRNGYFLLAALLLCLGNGAPGFAANSDLIEGAKKEGAIDWFGGGSAEIDEQINRGFMKKYPFIQARKTRVQSQCLLVRFETESRAGKHSADIGDKVGDYQKLFAEVFGKK